MPFTTPGNHESANVFIDYNKCDGCGQCTDVCKEFSFTIVNQKVVRAEKSFSDCVACGHCMMACPLGVIAVEGRSLSPVQMFELPDKSGVTSYKSFLTLLQHRRSTRDFKDKAVEVEKVNQILEAAQTAPMCIPPSGVHVMVLENKQSVHNFAVDFSNYLTAIRWKSSNWYLAFTLPFLRKNRNFHLQGLIQPVFNSYIDNMKKGVNRINYDAPLAMYFYGSPDSDPSDAIIAATYAMLAGESLGLGTCIIGGIHPYIQKGKKARLFREKQGIKHSSREGLFVVFGYTDVVYNKGVKRSFAEINRIS